jgi:hypothetical protein
VVNQAETVKAEREACAQIADDVAAIHDALGQGTSAATALRIRDAIRARRNPGNRYKGQSEPAEQPHDR